MGKGGGEGGGGDSELMPTTNLGSSFQQHSLLRSSIETNNKEKRQLEEDTLIYRQILQTNIKRNL